MNFINDVPLYNKEEDNINVVIEICPDTSDKNELVDNSFDRLVCVRQVVGKYPFYYGSFPQTYAGDKDPLDFILFTDKNHNLLDLVKVDVIGAVRTIDAGDQDDKIICVETDCGLKSVKKQMKKALKFLKRYKGKDADMKIDKKLASMHEAELLVEEAHMAWKEHVKPIRVTSNNKSNAIKKTSRVRVIRR